MTASLSFRHQTLSLDREHVLAHRVLIAREAYPERWEKEGFFQTHSVRKGSDAERVGWFPFHLITSINGVRPTSLAHIKELPTGGESKAIIFRGWSAKTFLMHDFHEVGYWTYEIELKKAGE